jgi:hypothetical protein
VQPAAMLQNAMFEMYSNVYKPLPVETPLIDNTTKRTLLITFKFFKISENYQKRRKRDC